MKKGKWLTIQIKIIYRLLPLSTPVSCCWTMDNTFKHILLKGISIQIEGGHKIIVPITGARFFEAKLKHPIKKTPQYLNGVFFNGMLVG